MRPFSEETDLRPAHVQPRAHPVAMFGRCGDGHLRGKLEASDARERVGDDERFQLELTRICDVRVEAAAAQPVARRRAAIARWLVGGKRFRVRDALGDTVDACRHALARNRAADENHLTLGPRDHPTTGSRLLDGQRKDLPCREHHVNAIVGRPASSLIKRSIAASRARV